MKQKNIILISIIILAGLVIWGINSGKIYAPGNSLALSISSANESSNLYNIQAEYPQFKNVSSSFNKGISDLITGKITAFKKDSADNWAARKATATAENPVPEYPEEPFDFICTWEPMQLNNNYISFVVKLYYFVGGAHGLNEIYTFNYDVTKGKEITILDFLNSSQESFDKLAMLAEQDVISQLQAMGIPEQDAITQMVKDGTKATQENYKNFNFNHNSLTVYYQQYQVAPGSVGELTSTFYKSVLDQNSIKTDYLK